MARRDDPNVYYIGSAVVVEAQFRVAGVLTAPTSPTLKVRDPSGTIVTYSGGTLTTVAAGIYQAIVYPTAAGEWTWRAYGTGPAYGAAEGNSTQGPAGRFTVLASAF